MKFSAVAAWVMIGSLAAVGMSGHLLAATPAGASGQEPFPSNSPTASAADAPAPLDPPAASASEGAPEGIAPVAPEPAPEPEPEGRILGIIPNNKTVPAVSPRPVLEPPLTIGEKYWLATKDTFDPYTLVLAGFYAGIAQLQDDFPTFGLGAAGYGKRIGAAYADQAVGNYMTEAIFPVFLHEDPRYFRRGYGSKWTRVGYALTRTVVTRTDKGTDRFNFSEVAGNAVAAGISNLYYPASERTVGETAEKWAVQIISDSAFNILLEFWPDMRHAVLKK